MTEKKSKLDRYYDRKPAGFTVLESLTLSQGVDPVGVMTQSLSVKLSSKSSHEILVLKFTGVEKLEIRQPMLSEISFWIEILDGHDLPTVGGRYLVRDPEQERVLFFECAEFEMEDI